MRPTPAHLSNSLPCMPEEWDAISVSVTYASERFRALRRRSGNAVRGVACAAQKGPPGPKGR